MLRIVLPWAVFGLVVERGVVTRAAPIAGWCVGKSAKSMAIYWKGRGARVEEMP